MKIGEHKEALQQRVRVLARGGWAALAGLAGAFFFVQVVEGARYRELAENNRLRRLPVEAPRGTIVDRHGRVLVENIPSYNLPLDRSRARDLGSSLAFAAEVVARPRAELDAVLEEIAAIKAFCAERSFDVAFYPGMRVEEANRYNVVERPDLFDAATALPSPAHSRNANSTTATA